MNELTPAAAWQKMLEGNRRFTSDQLSEMHQSSEKRAALQEGQSPFALVFGCSDSRVAAEIIFDQGLGQLFVVRTAGHIAGPAVMGSIEFGVQILGIPLIVVLGHQTCGAVRAALDSIHNGAMPPGYLRDVVERVLPAALAVNADRDRDLDPAAVLAEHVRQSAQLLVERSQIVATAVKEGRLAIVGATYHLSDGAVSVETSIGAV